MNKIKNICLFIFISFFVSIVNAQSPATSSDGKIVTVQPKIMVIPFTKQGEDIRTILEADVNRRIAITKIKEAFDSRGFTTVDFTAKLKSALDNKAFTSDNQSDIKTQIIQMSGADIYVQSEVNIQKTQSGTSVSVILTGYEASTGNSLANKVGESGKFFTDDISKLSSKAVENISQDFLNALQLKFSDIVKNGKSINIDFSFDQSSEYTMSSEFGSDGLLLSDHIELWMEANAFQNNYHIQGTSDLAMIFDDVRIPLKDQATGNNYNPNKFALEIFKFLKGLGLQCDRNIKGNTIYITIK